MILGVGIYHIDYAYSLFLNLFTMKKNTGWILLFMFLAYVLLLKACGATAN